MSHVLNPRTGRLNAATVRRLERLIGGDAMQEHLVLQFIEAKYGALNLFELPGLVAEQILKRPEDFLRAVTHREQPELSLR